MVKEEREEKREQRECAGAGLTKNSRGQTPEFVQLFTDMQTHIYLISLRGVGEDV